MKTILRVKDGEIFILDRLANGKFQVGDPKFASDKGHPDRRVFVDTIEEVLSFVGEGYSVRLRSLDTGRLTMISPPALRIVDVPV
jgi:hypothetical protein